MATTPVLMERDSPCHTFPLTTVTLTFHTFNYFKKFQSEASHVNRNVGRPRRLENEIFLLHCRPVVVNRKISNSKSSMVTHCV